MIFTIHIKVVKCDRCGGWIETNAATDRIAIETAERNGWVIADKGDWLRERHYCPHCL